MKLIPIVLYITLLSWVTGFCHAQDLSERVTHDLFVVPGGYQVAGADPYLILESNDPLLSLSENQHDLTINLSITGLSDSAPTPSLELFYQTQAGNLEQFDPYQRLKIMLPSNEVKGFKLKVPTELSLSDSRLRLDLNGCRTCTVRPLSGTFEQPASGTVTRAYLGRSELPDTGLVLEPKLWSSHDLDHQNNGYRITGGDPYLVSPTLDVDTGNVGGVLFEFTPPQADRTAYDFQLFYATEKHAFIEPASSIIRTSVNHGKLKFLVPLNFLNSEFPPRQTLERLRLDITEHSVVSGTNKKPGLWSLDSAKLVSAEQLPDLAQLIPSGLVNTKLQQQSKSQVVRGIFSKITRDWGFVITYLLMLLLMTIIFWRKYKGS